MNTGSMTTGSMKRSSENTIAMENDGKAAFPYGLVVRIRRSHRRGPGSIPGVGIYLLLFCSTKMLHLLVPSLPSSSIFSFTTIEDRIWKTWWN